MTDGVSVQLTTVVAALADGDARFDILVEGLATPIYANAFPASSQYELTDFADKLAGGTTDDVIRARAGDDVLDGGDGDDTLDGGDGNDTINGGTGADLLTGGDGDDRFKFVFDPDSIDTITDDSGGDIVDLSAIDGNLVEDGHQALIVEPDGSGQVVIENGQIIITLITEAASGFAPAFLGSEMRINDTGASYANMDIIGI
jgi:Ca2+-binding RTX toxin-like protein